METTLGTGYVRGLAAGVLMFAVIGTIAAATFEPVSYTSKNAEPRQVKTEAYAAASVSLYRGR